MKLTVNVARNTCFYLFFSKYQSGGADYVLSNKALKLMNSALESESNWRPIFYQSCPNNEVEDLDIGRCLRRNGIYCGESIDGKRERFHVESMQNHFNNVSLGWLKDYS